MRKYNNPFITSQIIDAATLVLGVVSTTVVHSKPEAIESLDIISIAPSSFKVERNETEILEPDDIRAISMAKSLQILNNIQKLPYDWNGYGARPVPIEVVNLCRRIVMNLNFQPNIFPTARRSVQMEYRLADRSYLELEVFEDYITTLEVPQRIYSKAKERKILSEDYLQLSLIVSKFCGGIDEWKNPQTV